MHVDEPGRHGEARGVHGASRRLAGEVADDRDALALDPHVGPDGGRARAIEHLPALDLDVQARGASANPMARSHQDAAPRSRVSAHGAPTSWMASGRRWASSPLGSEMAGMPA